MASKVSVSLAVLLLVCSVVSIAEGFGAGVGHLGKRSVKVRNIGLVVVREKIIPESVNIY